MPSASDSCPHTGSETALHGRSVATQPTVGAVRDLGDRETDPIAVCCWNGLGAASPNHSCCAGECCDDRLSRLLGPSFPLPQLHMGLAERGLEFPVLGLQIQLASRPAPLAGG